MTYSLDHDLTARPSSARPVTVLAYRHVSLDEFEAGLVAAGLDAGTAAFVTALERGAASGELDVPVTDLERVSAP